MSQLYGYHVGASPANGSVNTPSFINIDMGEETLTSIGYFVGKFIVMWSEQMMILCYILDPFWASALLYIITITYLYMFCFSKRLKYVCRYNGVLDLSLDKDVLK